MDVVNDVHNQLRIFDNYFETKYERDFLHKQSSVPKSTGFQKSRWSNLNNSRFKTKKLSLDQSNRLQSGISAATILIASDLIGRESIFCFKSGIRYFLNKPVPVPQNTTWQAQSRSPCLRLRSQPCSAPSRTVRKRFISGRSRTVRKRFISGRR